MATTLFSGLILRRGKFGRIPVPQLTLSWTVSWHRLLSYWLLRATQDTAHCLSLPWPTFFDPHLYSPSQPGLLLCYATLPLYIRPLGKLWWPPTHPSISHKPSHESFAGTSGQCTLQRGSSKLIPHQHRFVSISIRMGLSASASDCIGSSEEMGEGNSQLGILGEGAAGYAGSTTKYRVPTAILSSILMSLSSSAPPICPQPNANAKCPKPPVNFLPANP